VIVTVLRFPGANLRDEQLAEFLPVVDICVSGGDCQPEGAAFPGLLEHELAVSAR